MLHIKRWVFCSFNVVFKPPLSLMTSGHWACSLQDEVSHSRVSQISDTLTLKINVSVHVLNICVHIFYTSVTLSTFYSGDRWMFSVSSAKRSLFSLMFGAFLHQWRPLDCVQDKCSAGSELHRLPICLLFYCTLLMLSSVSNRKK